MIRKRNWKLKLRILVWLLFTSPLDLEMIQVFFPDFQEYAYRYFYNFIQE